MVKRPGNQNGLILEMFLGEPEFTPCWVKSRGGLVTINNKNSTPVFFEEGHYIQMGTETSYSLSQIDYRKLDEPYGECKTTNSSQRRCLIECTNKLNNQQNEINCGSNKSDLCLRNTKNVATFYSECSKTCPAECELSVYELTTDHASYPSLTYASNVLMNNEKFMKKFTFVTGSNVSFERVKQSTAALNVHFGTNFVQTFSEVPENSPLSL